jgi:hypothetical protein
MFLLFSNQCERLYNLQKFENIATVTYRFGEIRFGEKPIRL